MNLVTELHAVCATLTAAQIRYAICGGVAVTIHGATRSTKDIDILIAPTGKAGRVRGLVGEKLEAGDGGGADE